MLNLAAMQLLAKYPKLVGLSDMLKLRANQLDRSHFDRLAEAIGVEIPISDEVQNAILHLLRGKDINYVADLIQSPESVVEIVNFAKGGFRGLIEAKTVATSEFADDAVLLFIR
jgi:hypothetical protein